MPEQDETRLLSEIAHQVRSEDANTFKVVIVSSGYQAGILTNILTKSLQISKQQITQLGYTASDEQNASLLRKRNSIVIVPEPIIIHRPCQFHPQNGAKQISLFQILDEKVKVSRYPCSGEP